MGRNNRRNRRRRAHFTCTENIVEDRLSIGDFIGASRLVEQAKLQGWSSPRLVELSKRLAGESKSCPCWHCGFTPEQKQRVTVDAHRKAEVLDRSYDSHENNLIGGYAEAVFGAKFDLPIDLEPGGDGGFDFCIPFKGTPSGVLTIDVKGTKYTEFRLPGIKRPWGDIRGRGYDESFIRRPDHIYALIVIDREHAFFKGFAFGSDEFAIKFARFSGDSPGYYPRKLRCFDELLLLLSFDKVPE
jgi:hypothetical protein